MVKLELLERVAKYQVVLEAYQRVKSENDALRVQVGRLQEENHRLRRRLKEKSYRYRLLREAYENALLMVAFAGVGLPISRRAMAAYGMSQRKWQRARALLLVSRLFNGRRLMVDDQELIVERLNSVVERCERDDTSLRIRMPRHT